MTRFVGQKSWQRAGNRLPDKMQCRSGKLVGSLWAGRGVVVVNVGQVLIQSCQFQRQRCAGPGPLSDCERAAEDYSRLLTYEALGTFCESC